jgi:DNA-binding CsgD family transcriptional regulator
VRPMVLLGTFTFANNFVRHFLSDELKGVVLVGVMLAAAFVILLLAARSERFEMGVLYSASLPLIVAASLCVLFPAAGFGVAGAILSNAAYALFSIFTTSVLCSISYGYGVSAPWLFGFAQAAVGAGTLASNLIVGRFDFVESDPMLLTATTSIVVMAFVSLYAVFSGSGDSSGSWGIERTGAQSEDPLDDLQDSCARVFRRFGLTRREEQVMALLVQGDSFAQVEEKLSISNSTMKTHARHVYAKVGVSGRAELGEFVRRYR